MQQTATKQQIKKAKKLAGKGKCKSISMEELIKRKHIYQR